jgi:hypothetical protein
VILCEGEEFAVDESWLKPESHQPSGPTDASPSVLAEGQRALAQREKEMIEAALAACKGVNASEKVIRFSRFRPEPGIQSRAPVGGDAVGTLQQFLN